MFLLATVQRSPIVPMLVGLFFLITLNTYSTESTNYHKLPLIIQTQYAENDAVVLSARDPPAKEHFPAMPELPSDYNGEHADQFILIAETNLTQKREHYLLAQDVIGIPLGKADELYFTNEFQSSPPKEDHPINTGEQGEHFEGDISGVELISKSEDTSGLLNGKDGKNAIKNTYQMWPKGEIPYTISQTFSSYDRSVIRKSMNEISKASCIKWRARHSADKDYVHILRDAGCYSRVGKVGGPQILSLGKLQLLYLL